MVERENSKTVGTLVGNVNGCTHDMDVGIMCSATSRNFNPMHLVGGSTKIERLVDYFTGISHKWTPICGNLWTLVEADVVCRQLRLLVLMGGKVMMLLFRLCSEFLQIVGIEYACPL